MLYKQVKKLKPVDFRRLTGIKLETFAVMIEVLKEAESYRCMRRGVKF